MKLQLHIKRDLEFIHKFESHRKIIRIYYFEKYIYGWSMDDFDMRLKLIIKKDKLSQTFIIISEHILISITICKRKKDMIWKL